ncbi:hypothetical protein [Deinococcus xinjiangensis]|uniref:hypothetical protein n=1 Tax=Deinococcus xinjiangensis TaxID=457454 RepID=UPI0033654BBF
MRQRLNKAGYKLNNIKFSDEEDEQLIDWFNTDFISPQWCAIQLGRTAKAVLDRAGKLGILEHPDKRSKKDLAKIAARQAELSLKKRVTNTAGTLPLSQEYPDRTVTQSTGKWQSGWYKIGEHQFYFRSKWEANYAHYLEWRCLRGEILKWEYEVDLFVFHEVQSGNRVYKPDFKVWTSETEFYYDEVKGWNDPGSKTRLRRMAKYYPEVTVNLIDGPVYHEIKNKLGHVIPGWLHNE